MRLLHVTAGLLAAGLLAGAQAATVLSEGFDSVAALGTAGWVFTNNSTPVGQSWFQGNEGVFAAQAGAAGAYVATNFLSTSTDSGSIDSWLISPELTLGAGATLSFYTRAADAGFLDLLEVRFSSGNSSAVASFTTLLGTVGSTTSAAYPVNGWQLVTLTLPTAASGRIAFHYSVADANNASYIGIDSVLVSTVPEPVSLALFGLGLAAVGTAARRRAGAANASV